MLGLSHPDTASQEICTGAGYCNPEPGRNSYSTTLNGKDADGNWMPVPRTKPNPSPYPSPYP